MSNNIKRLGFGCMRLPINTDGTVNEKLTADMVELAISSSVNFFDNAYPYHAGDSEKIIGKILKKYPRESYILSTKFPGHQICDSHYPAPVFKEQLERFNTDYFDYYLLHNINENSYKVYTDPKWGIIDYFKEQKNLGKIRHLGFSCHCSLELLRDFLDKYGDDMEFCLMQLNYLDWTLQDGKAKYELLTERGIPVWVMEPVRGGKLANLPEEIQTELKACRTDESVASWGFRFLLNLPNVKMILSGMSNIEQMQDNIKTFSEDKPLNENETNLLLNIAEKLKNSVPCTSCGYCLKDCPMRLNIPYLISIYNELRVQKAVSITMRLDALPDEKQPSACINCGMCIQNCPQSINIPEELNNMTEILSSMPKWADICRERLEHMKKMQ